MRPFILIGLLLPLMLAGRFSVHADDATPAATMCQPPAPAAGFEAHIDPATGRFVPPSPGSAAPGASAGVPRSGDTGTALVEVPNPAAAGGVGVRLRGQFDSTVTATVGADGKARTGCATGGQGPVRP